METTEKIVEAYLRYIKGWFTIPNIKCKGQKEIDLLAVDTSNLKKIKRYHIECTVSVSRSYSKITLNPFSEDDLKDRVKKAGQRRTLGYFIKCKFGDSYVMEMLATFGFKKGNYRKIIVTWEWEEGVPAAAKNEGIDLLSMKNILSEIAENTLTKRTYYIDDTMRTLQLLTKAWKPTN